MFINDSSNDYLDIFPYSPSPLLSTHYGSWTLLTKLTTNINLTSTEKRKGIKNLKKKKILKFLIQKRDLPRFC